MVWYPLNSWVNQISAGWVSFPRVRGECKPSSESTACVPAPWSFWFSKAWHFRSTHTFLATQEILGSELRCLSVLAGWKSSISSTFCCYFHLIGHIYCFPFISYIRKKRYIHRENKYLSLCKHNTFLHDMKAHISYCLLYVTNGSFFGYSGFKCSRNAHNHWLKKSDRIYWSRSFTMKGNVFGWLTVKGFWDALFIESLKSSKERWPLPPPTFEFNEIHNQVESDIINKSNIWLRGLLLSSTVPQAKHALWSFPSSRLC